MCISLNVRVQPCVCQFMYSCISLLSVYLHINECVFMKRERVCVCVWCEWQALRCLVCLCIRLKDRQEPSNFLSPLSLFLSLNHFLTSPRRCFTSGTHTFTPISTLPLSLSLSFPLFLSQSMCPHPIPQLCHMPIGLLCLTLLL